MLTSVDLSHLSHSSQFNQGTLIKSQPDPRPFAKCTSVLSQAAKIIGLYGQTGHIAGLFSFLTQRFLIVKGRFSFLKKVKQTDIKIQIAL